MKKKNTYFTDILHNYHRLRIKDDLFGLSADFLIVNFLALVIFLAIESLWYLPANVKQNIWYLGFLNAVFIYRFFKIIFHSQKNKKEDENDLLTIGDKFLDVEDKLLVHAQLAEQDGDIARLAVEEFIKNNDKNKFFNTYTPKNKSKKLRSIMVLISLLMVFALFLPKSYERVFKPGVSFEPNIKAAILFSTTDTSIYSYDSLSFDIRTRHAEKYILELYEENVENGEVKLLLRSRDSIISYQNNRLNSSREYYALLRRPNIFYPRFYLAADTLSVDVMQRPQIRSIDILIESPEYSGIPDAHYQGNIDKISCLYGSMISISMSLSEDPGEAILIMDDKQYEMRMAYHSCHIEFEALKSGKLAILVKNLKNISTETLPVYEIDIVEDEFPSLSLLTPRQNEEYLLNENMSLPYVAQLQDDYGLSHFYVEYTIHSEYSFLPDTTTYKHELELDKGLKYQTRAGIWEIDNFVSPGSEIRYSFLIYDNDVISGPKYRRSTTFYAKLPTLTDLFESNREQNDEQTLALEEKSELVEEIAEDIEEIRKELLQEGKLDWENKSALEENLSMLEEGQKDLQEIQKAMEEQKKFMDENTMFSEKVMNDFEQLQELMNELMDDELFDMMQELQEKMKRNDDSNMEKILEEFSEKAKKFEESLDRMLEIFKRIQQEQRLEELGERMKDAIKNQQDILEKSDQRSGDELAQQESQLSDETQSMENLANESAELFSENDDSAYEDFLEQMNQEAVSDLMQQSSESFSKGEKQTGQEQGQQSKDKLSQLQEQFSSMSGEMMQKQKEAVENAFRKAFLQCMYMSSQQENSNGIYSGIENNSPLLHAYTSTEYDILALATELNAGLLQLSKMTFLVDKALGQKLGAVMAYLKSGIVNIEQAKLSTGKKHIKLAFKSMNELGRILLERMNMVRDEQQGNASGMDFYMQQLQQMAGQQQQLNQGMQQMGMDGSPSQSLIDQMAKMAARQQALRRSLKGLQQSMEEGGQGKRMMGDLDRIAKDMEDVINQMRKNNVNRQTMMRQEQILQRLLDASRSATSRDYKKERESKSGQAMKRENSLSLPVDLGERELLINSIRRELRETNLSPQEKRQMEIYLESLLNEQTWQELSE